MTLAAVALVLLLVGAVTSAEAVRIDLRFERASPQTGPPIVGAVIVDGAHPLFGVVGAAIPVTGLDGPFGFGDGITIGTSTFTTAGFDLHLDDSLWGFLAQEVALLHFGTSAATSFLELNAVNAGGGRLLNIGPPRVMGTEPQPFDENGDGMVDQQELSNRAFGFAPDHWFVWGGPSSPDVAAFGTYGFDREFFTPRQVAAPVPLPGTLGLLLAALGAYALKGALYLPLRLFGALARVTFPEHGASGRRR